MNDRTASSDYPINNTDYELNRLQEIAKLASIYHEDRNRYEKNPNLTRVVHIGLHIVQLMCTVSVDIFHHAHHARIRQLQEIHPNLPDLPREDNPLFFIYPICSLMCIIFVVLWLVKRALPGRSLITLLGCALAAGFTLIAGLWEMVQVEEQIDISQISDEDLLGHPIFIHNFVMCILSIFCMMIYLTHMWLLFDYHRWETRKPQESTDISITEEPSTSDADVPRATTLGQLKKFDKKANKRNEKPGDLDPIPFLDSFPTVISLPDDVDVEDEPVILYCCFVDWYNHIKKSYVAEKPTHEFQVIHVV